MPVLVTAVALVVLASTASDQEPTRLVAASNLRLRAAPADTAPIVARVPLGLALVELETGGEGGSWVRVRLADGQDGWTPSKLTRKYTADTRWSVVESLVRERLGRRGDSFQARVELVDFVERARGDVTDPEVSGRLAMHWLQAMSQAFAAIPTSQAHAQPYAGWLDVRRTLVVFNEPAGRWMLRREAILDLHARENVTGSADDIIWFLTMNGLPGECEGFVPCAVRRTNDLEGEYLRRHSAGRHAAEAVARVAERAAGWAMRGPSSFYDPARDCAELTTALTPLREAVATTRAERRGDALDALDRLKCAIR